MGTTWENTFSTWAQAPSDTERQKCENAVNGIRNAISSSEVLKKRNIDVFIHGSYRNHTNVKLDSDIDIGITCKNVYFYELPDNITPQQVGIVPSDYQYQTFKSDVINALISYFGQKSVLRRNKTIDLKENTYRVEADVTPFFEHRYYISATNYHQGVELRPDNGLFTRIINWPEQHYCNGVAKNDHTHQRYNRIVRIVKKLINYMVDQGVTEVNSLSGFLVECLLWNVADDLYSSTSHLLNLREALVYLTNNTRDDQSCATWTEVSQMKYLFHQDHLWTRSQVNISLNRIWNYLGMK